MVGPEDGPIGAPEEPLLLAPSTASCRLEATSLAHIGPSPHRLAASKNRKEGTAVAVPRSSASTTHFLKHFARCYRGSMRYFRRCNCRGPAISNPREEAI